MTTDASFGRLKMGFAAQEWLRWAAVDVGPVVEEARQRLDLSPVAAVAMGRALAGAALLLRMSSKKAVRISVDARGSGELSRVYAEADARGRLRGLVGNKHATNTSAGQEGEIRIGAALGEGLLEVKTEDESNRTWTSRVALVNGEIGTDIAHFLEQSEQRHSAVALGVLADPSGVLAAGGIILEALPGAPSAAIEAAERAFLGLSQFSRLLNESGLDGVVAQALGDSQGPAVEEMPLCYACSCDRTRLRSSLGTLSEEDRAYLGSADGKIDVECAYCGNTYTFAADEVSDGGAVN